jgi:hypothetical protein
MKVVQGGKCLLAWKKVQQSCCLGRLNILDLKLSGNALRLRWMWLQQTDTSRSWLMLPIVEVSSTIIFFHASIEVILGDGGEDLRLEGCLAGRAFHIRVGTGLG